MNNLARTFSRLSLLVAFVCLMATIANAQSNRQLLRSGNKLFDRENYREAATYYERVIANDPNNAEALYLAGVSYVTFDKEKAIDYVTRAYTIKPNVDRDVEYWLGRINHLNYRFDDAIRFYEAYQPKIRRRDDARRDEVARLIQHSKNAKREVATPKDVFVKNLGGTINTSYSEHSPVISSDERYLLFTSRGEQASGGRRAADGEFYEDIFETRKSESGEWEAPRSLAGSLSSTVHDASIQLFDNDTKMLLYRSQNNGDIMYSERNSAGAWGPPVSIGDNINTRDFESDAFITPDGQTLYFSTSHYSEERGDLDIYVSRRQANGQWGKPESIGNTINSEYDDDSPYLAADGTLYFASRGHNTMGGYDIFAAKYDSVARRWGRPENLGSPVNTPDDDTYYRLSPDGSYAYLTSYRIGGYGEKDIYTINYIRNVRLVGQVFSLPDSVAIPGVELIFSGTQADRRPISYRDITRPDSGNYEVSVLSGRNYQVQVLKDGKSIATQEYEVPMALNDTTSIRKDFYVPYTDAAIAGTRDQFRKIYYDTDQYDLRTESIRELDNVARILKANPNMNLSIEGHCDSRASDEYNMTLGDNRAKAAFDYLVAQGISPRRLVTVSYGERRPAVPNTSAENMQLNRRTEFRVIERQGEGPQPGGTTPNRR